MSLPDRIDGKEVIVTSYNVVFEGTGGPRSNYAGVRTWTSFRDKAHFQEWQRSAKNFDRVIAEGVSQEKAIALSNKTPLEAQVGAIFAEFLRGMSGALALAAGYERTENELGEVTLSRTTLKESLSLWPRFRGVHNAIAAALAKEKPEGVERTMETEDLSGREDDGISDHNGSVVGRINDIDLNITLRGTTVVLGDEMSIRDTKSEYLLIEGTFTSKDGLRGFVRVALKNDATLYEAYWLQTKDGLRLEQVINQDGVVSDANLIDPEKEVVEIPGTDIQLQRYRPL